MHALGELAVALADQAAAGEVHAEPSLHKANGYGRSSRLFLDTPPPPPSSTPTPGSAETATALRQFAEACKSADPSVSPQGLLKHALFTSVALPRSIL